MRRSGPRPPRSPSAPPQSFLWTRRVVLSFLAAFALLPVYVM
ncbi:carbohydrate ABC transporter permease, partial [Streptomyces lunaelactis]|nr:carbohydrate ABC transporter permease [Streptomyces lunaelactis]